MYFSSDQRLVITKAIIEPTHMSGGSSLAKRSHHGGNRFDNNAMVFYGKDTQIVASHHNKPLYVTAYISDVEFGLVIVDTQVPC